MMKKQMMKKQMKSSLIAYLVCILLVPVAWAQIIQDESIKESHVFGYLITRSEKVDESYGGGYSMYVPAYPLVKDYPGRAFQSGLFSFHNVSSDA